jgi:hypothetical protein
LFCHWVGGEPGVIAGELVIVHRPHLAAIGEAITPWD